jgi:hypothetical protein
MTENKQGKKQNSHNNSINVAAPHDALVVKQPLAETTLVVPFHIPQSQTKPAQKAITASTAVRLLKTMSFPNEIPEPVLAVGLAPELVVLLALVLLAEVLADELAADGLGVEPEPDELELELELIIPPATFAGVVLLFVPAAAAMYAARVSPDDLQHYQPLFSPTPCSFSPRL